jgi:hypothetical protein
MRRIEMDETRLPFFRCCCEGTWIAQAKILLELP